MRQYSLSLTSQVSFHTDCSGGISRDQDGPCRKTVQVCCVRVCTVKCSFDPPVVSGDLVSDIKAKSYHMGEGLLNSLHQGL